MENHTDLDTVLDEALDSMPQIPLPAGLISSIMQQVDPAINQVEAPAFVSEPFRLRSADIAVAAVVSLMFAFFVLVGLNWIGLVDVSWLSAEIPQIPWLTSTTAIALAAVPLELILAYALYEAFADTAL